MSMTETVLQTASLFAVAIATGFTAYQVHLTRRQTELSIATTRAGIYQGIAQEMLTIDRFFIEYPILRPFFYNNAPASSAGSSFPLSLEGTAEMLVDFADDVYLQARNLREQPPFPGEMDIWERWAAYFHDLYLSSSVLRDFVSSKEAWLKPGLCMMLRTGKLPN